jgi:hypothetical protein
LVLQVLVTHRLVNFSNTGIVAVLEKPDFQSSEPVAPELGFVHKKACIARGEVRGQAVPIGGRFLDFASMLNLSSLTNFVAA